MVSFLIGAVLYAVSSDYPVCNAEVCPERQNDMVWENDKFGMRAYGPGEYHKWSGFVSLFEDPKGEGGRDGSTMSAILVADPPAVEWRTDHMNCRVLCFKRESFTYWAGASWSLAGEITTPEQWHAEVRRFAQTVRMNRGNRQE